MTFLITGTGHSGTMWAARLFTRLGHDCGHERWHTPEPYAGMPTPDSSWLAVPRLDRLPEGTRVLHLVRDPLAVLQSMLAIRFLTDGKAANPYTGFVRWARPDIWSAGGQLDRCVAYVARWDTPAEAVGSWLLPIERAEPRVVCDTVEWATDTRPDEDRAARVLTELGTRVHTHRRPDRDIHTRVTIEQASATPAGGEFLARMERFGYATGR